MLEMKQVTIIGTGLLGASLALALRAKGFTGRIVGVGRRVEVLEQARGLGCFDDLTVSTAEALASARDLPGGPKHVAVLAAPLGHFEEIFRKIAPCDDPDLIITDVGSTKSSVCQLAKELLPDPARFVGSHPMAGSEQTGPGAADGDLFESKPCVVTPGNTAESKAVELVEAMWRGVGMRVVRMSPEEHDRSVALVSHLPHAVAALLVDIADEGALDIASTGFADTTRIASGDPALWLDIFNQNKPAVLDSLQRLTKAVEYFREIMETNDDDLIVRLLSDAKDKRDRWQDRR